jgi:hypothetical protein
MASSPEPLHCALPAGDAANQALEWSELRGRALSRETLDGGIAMTFELDLAAAVEDLAARESQCCSFLDITTACTDQHIRVEITSEHPDAPPVVELLAGPTMVTLRTPRRS